MLKRPIYSMVKFPNKHPSQPLSSRDPKCPASRYPKDKLMTKKPHRKTPLRRTTTAELATLASVTAALERAGKLSPTRLRDLRSAVKRVAILLKQKPGAISLDMEAISSGLGAVSPAAVGLTAKRFANIRSDFVAAVKASGVALANTGLKSPLSPAWANLFAGLKGRRDHIGLSRFARYASSRGIAPEDVNDDVIVEFIAAIRRETLCPRPNTLHRQVTQIWNEAARDPQLGLGTVIVPSFRGPARRIQWAILSEDFRKDVEDYLSWCSMSDPFAADARIRALAPTSVRLVRDQIHAAVSALVEGGAKPAGIRSLANLVAPENMKKILRQRLAGVGGQENVFNYTLGKALVQIAREWVKVDPPILAELRRLLGKLPVPLAGMTQKNKGFLRQFDDPEALWRLLNLPNRLWTEVKKGDPNFRTLAKAQAALAIAILSYMPLRMKNLVQLEFDTHLFLHEGHNAVSSLEFFAAGVKNKVDLAFDIPPHVAKMLIEYRDRIAPSIIGERPTRLFVNVDGSPKCQKALGRLIATYSKSRAGIVLTPHQFRHLSAKNLLDAEPGSFETVKQLLGHRSLKTTVGSYAGIDSRRAARHHQRLVDQAIAAPMPKQRRIKHKPTTSSRKRRLSRVSRT